jgi:hypothetical protein
VKKIVNKMFRTAAQGEGPSGELSRDAFERQLLLTGKLASLEVRRLDRIRSLADVEFRVTSQWGEDGIIEWLCHKLPGIHRSFIEFGVEDYAEANTRFLLANRGWKGLVLDGSEDNMNRLRSEAVYWKFDLSAQAAFITKENIDELIEASGFSNDLGLLSIDIDGNDYWVLDAISCVNPAILICEYNAIFGDRQAVTIPYSADFDRLTAHHSGQYYGASIGALVQLAEKKGYRFVGTNSNGINAFFVRGDLAGPVLGSLDAVKAWPSRHRDARDSQGKLAFTRGIDRADLIRDTIVLNLATGSEQSVGSLGPLYSDEWIQEM